MNTQKNIKRFLPLIATIAILTITASGCSNGNSTSNATQAPNGSTTATEQSQTTFDTSLAGNNITGTLPQYDGVVITTPPTIIYDDSAAAPFWEPVPEGMDPADFSPKYLTREEVTKYVALPDPDPAAWTIPENGPTPEYAERVLNYILTLRSGLLRAGVAFGVDNPRVRESAVAPYTGSGIDSFLERLDHMDTRESQTNEQWTSISKLEVHEVEYLETTDGPCMFVRATFLIPETGSQPDRWFRLIRNGPANWLNPTGWRGDVVVPGDWPDLRAVSCEEMQSRS